MIADRYDVDAAYFAEKYNMPVGERRDFGMAQPFDDEEDLEKKQKITRSFFD